MSNIKIGSNIKGRTNTLAIEKGRAAEVRREAYQPECGFFDGTYESYIELPAEIRGIIDDAVKADIEENKSLWESSEDIVIRESGFVDNLILNSGLDWCCSNSSPYFSDFSLYHAIGTGTSTPAVTDTTLQSEVKRTSTYLTGTGNCGRTNTGNVITFRRTYDHSIESGSVNYTEHGVSDASSTTVNTRVLIGGGTLSLVAGQLARVVYDIIVTASPATPTAVTVGGSGWPVLPATTCDGDCILSTLDQLLGTLSTSGNGSGSSFLIGSDVALNSAKAAALSAITLPSFGSGATKTEISGSEIAYNLASYTSGSFTFTASPVDYASAASWSSTSIAGWVFGHNKSAFVFKYDENQTKANTHRLRYPSYTVTWSR